MQRTAFLLFSVFFLSISYSQDLNSKKKYLIGYLDNDNIIDTLSYYKSDKVIKCDLLSSILKLKFEFDDTTLNFGFDNPKKGVVSFVNSGTGQTRIEEFQFYIFDSDIKNWVLSKSISTSSMIDKNGNLTVPYISFEYSNEKDNCITIDDKEVKCNITKPEKNAIVQLISNAKNKKNVKFETIEYLFNYPLSDKNVAMYNDLAYYLYNENISLYVLESIIKKYPNRVVAYLNLADSYFNLGNQFDAVKNYKKYISLMKSQKKDVKKIPKYVYERIK